MKARLLVKVLNALYRKGHNPVRIANWIARLEGGVIHSATLRECLAWRGIRLGKYSYGSMATLHALPKGTVIGPYCSLGDGLRVFRRNHPSDRFSTHPFFYNAACGVVERDTIGLDEHNPLMIEADCWIGAGSTILPNCRRVGLGSVVGAASVVTRDCEDFKLLAGNPARVLRDRFTDPIRDLLRESRWWTLDIERLHPYLSLFVEAATSESVLQLGRVTGRGSEGFGMKSEDIR